jgi:putative ABC transport system permease protein
MARHSQSKYGFKNRIMADTTKQNLPPKFFLKFFRWYCHPKLRDHIEGDLLEAYGNQLKESGKRKADLQFIMEVLLLFRRGIIRPVEGHQTLNTYGMYKSYFKVGWRNLVRNKGYSLINIGGLAIGMAVALLNGLWILHEFSFNKYFENYDRIAQVTEKGYDTERGGEWINTTMTYPLGTELINNHSGAFKRIARTSWQSSSILSVGEKKMSANGLYVDKDYPEIFSFKMLEGSRGSLAKPQSIMISASAAKTLFGYEDPLNRTISINNKTDLLITGVFEDFPENTNLRSLQFFAPWDVFLADNKWIEERAQNDWRNHFMKIYVELPEEEMFASASVQIRSALRFDPQDQEEATKSARKLNLYPMDEWHLHPPGLRQGQPEPIVMLRMVGAIGLFVLMLACINFMNLSTARSEKRAKEVGIRKTIGSVRNQLIHQFFTESLIIVCFAFLLALMLTAAFLPTFNEIADKQITIPLSNGWFWAAAFGFVILTSGLAGSYPALYLSSFNPIRALKGTFRVGRMAALPRKVLVVFQFSISVILIIGTAIVHQQIQYAKARPVGYDREGLIMIDKKTDDFYGKYDVLRTEWKNTGVVAEVSESMGPVTEIVSGNNGWDWEGRDPNIDESFATLAVSHLHGKTAGWQFVQGRDFDVSQPGDSSGVVINETALKLMALKEPIGQRVTWTWWVDKQKMDYTILGVVKDMVMESPYAPIEPTVFYLKGFNGTPNWLNIKIDPKVSLQEALPKIEKVFKKVIPTAPFEYKFADEEYAMKFGKEERIGNVATIFAVLAILISCLGLLGLASFVAEKRTKEIGIRKVLGASVSNLWQMLSKDFIVLVIIACLVASPIAYYLLGKWLSKFTYHTDISIWILISTALGAIGLSLLTVSYQAVKAALMNPVRSLRSE